MPNHPTDETTPVPAAAHFERKTTVAIATPAPDAPDLTHPQGTRIVIPQRVELKLTRIETPDGCREWALVSVHGPRRLKSGAPGREISIYGWEASANCWGRQSADRPTWLTRLLADHLPDGWSPHLLDLTPSA
ncbi:hypothetical protein ABZW44_22635 [Streptomyces mirabilis]|uniref:hypothetical protein n=1 Tax=Streptomyces mirabilis TaxID=68239 RepID=UPI0033AD82A4